jgi:hypothetical protein
MAQLRLHPDIAMVGSTIFLQTARANATPIGALRRPPVPPTFTVSAASDAAIKMAAASAPTDESLNRPLRIS